MKHAIEVKYLIRAVVGCVLLGGVLLAAGISDQVHRADRPANSGHGTVAPATPADALIHTIELRAEQDTVAELRRGR